MIDDPSQDNAADPALYIYIFNVTNGGKLTGSMAYTSKSAYNFSRNSHYLSIMSAGKWLLLDGSLPNQQVTTPTPSGGSTTVVGTVQCLDDPTVSTTTCSNNVGILK